MDFSQTLPALDQNLCNVWTELDPNQYQKYAFYLVKAEAERRKRKAIWSNVITDTIPWTPNLSTVMRSVIVEKSPLMRQSARPNYITVDPTVDIFNVRERIAETRLQWHDFESPHFSFLPSFQDFMEGNLVPSRQNLEDQVMDYEDIFLRTAIWDNSPNVYIAGQGKVQAPVGVDASMASNKTAAFVESLLQRKPGFLTAQELFNAASIFADEVGATPFQGDALPQGDNEILDQKFMLITSNQAWMQFTNDPFIRENRPLAMNIVNQAFKGPLFDTIVARIEPTPLRWTVDANGSPTEADREIVELNANSPNYGRPIPNPNYAQIDLAPYEVAWLVGGRHYKRVKTGPPPEFFAGSVSDPSKLPGMTWNGQIYSTRNFLIPCKDRNGVAQVKLNDRGRYIKFQGSLALGVLGLYTWNIMPIIFRRRLGLTTTGQPA